MIFNYKVLINLTMNYIKHIEDVHKMCRICLSKSKNMICLSEKIDETENSQSIITYLENNFSLKVFIYLYLIFNRIFLNFVFR